MSLDYMLIVNMVFVLSVSFLSSRFIFFIIMSLKETFSTAKGAGTEIISLLTHFIPRVQSVSKTLLLAVFSLQSKYYCPRTEWKLHREAENELLKNKTVCSRKSKIQEV